MCVVDGAVPRGLQEVLPGQTQRPQAAVAADPGPLCAQGRLSHGGYRYLVVFQFTRVNYWVLLKPDLLTFVCVLNFILHHFWYKGGR